MGTCTKEEFDNKYLTNNDNMSVHICKRDAYLTFRPNTWLKCFVLFQTVSTSNEGPRKRLPWSADILLIRLLTLALSFSSPLTTYLIIVWFKIILRIILIIFASISAKIVYFIKHFLKCKTSFTHLLYFWRSWLTIIHFFA